MFSKLNPYILNIIVFNMIPILGVAFYDWSPFEMFWLFWMETLIISIFNTVRVLFSQSRQPHENIEDNSISLNYFSSLKYLVLRIFVFLFYSLFIFVFIGLMASKDSEPLRMVKTLAFQNLLFNIALLSAIATNVYYLIRFFFINGAYRYSKPSDYSGIFDGRQIVIHIAVVLGAVGSAFLFKKSGNAQYASVWIISVFCITKCIFELLLARKNAINTAQIH